MNIGTVLLLVLYFFMEDLLFDIVVILSHFIKPFLVIVSA